MNETKLVVTGRNLPVSESTRRRNPERYGQAGGVPSNAVEQRDPVHEPVGKDARKAPDTRRRLVRLTSYRKRLCDERNLWDKHFVDALVRAGLLVDDSPEHCKIEVGQVEIERPEDERTEITIETLIDPDAPTIPISL